VNEQPQPGRDATLERAAFRALEQLARALGEAADVGRAVRTRWEAVGGDPARGLTFTAEIGHAPSRTEGRELPASVSDFAPGAADFFKHHGAGTAPSNLTS
jgi:hypothetical protein